MHRAPFLALLDRYANLYPEERQCSTRYIDFVKTQPRCFERTFELGHITGSAWILNAAGTHTLLTHHRKLDRWLQLGGHVDGDPDVLAGAEREAHEESGIDSLEAVSPEIFDLDIHPIPARGDEPEHLHYDARFLFRSTHNEDYVLSDESHELAWVPLEKIEDYSHEESISRMVRKTLALP